MGRRHAVAVGHATGNQNVREALRALSDAQLLSSFTTSLGFRSVDTIPVPSLRRLTQKRTFSMLEGAELHVHPWRELIRAAARRSPSRGLRASTSTAGSRGPQWVAAGNDAYMAKKLHSELGAAYGYLGQASQTFERAKMLGLKTILEAHHATMPTTVAALEAERQRSPEWSATIPDLSQFLDHGLAEVRSADMIIAPSGQVTASILRERPTAKVIEIPYGCPPVLLDARPLRWDGRGRLKLLFVGRLQAVKGLADIAWLVEKLSHDASITVVGQRPAVQCSALDNFLTRADYRGALPHGEVLNLMREHHALILPSIVEGRSLTVLEALSQGLPVLTTPGSGTDDLVSQGGGHVVPVGARDDLLAATLSWLENPAVIEQMSVEALNSARASSWTEFRSRLADVVNGLIGEQR